MAQGLLRAALVAGALIVGGCPAETPIPPELPAPDLYCPGGPTCSAALADDTLLAAAVTKVVLAPAPAPAPTPASPAPVLPPAVG